LVFFFSKIRPSVTELPGFLPKDAVTGIPGGKRPGYLFIDSKQVRIKGSEVGLSLMTIEKILSRQDRGVAPGQHNGQGIGSRMDKVRNSEGNHTVGASKDLAGQMHAPSALAKVPESATGDIPLKRKKKKKHGLRL
jgi:hypothetical protein